MKPTTKLILTLVIVAISIVVMLFPVGYWVFHSEYSSMAIFLKFWYLYIPGGVVCVIALNYSKNFLIESYNEKDSDEKDSDEKDSDVNYEDKL
jgi:hypothetical protein